MLCSVAQLCLTLCNPMDCSPPGFSVHGNSPGKNIRAGCHALLQGIFPTQESNRGLLHCRRILNQLSYQGSHKVRYTNLIKYDPVCRQYIKRRKMPLDRERSTRLSHNVPDYVSQRRSQAACLQLHEADRTSHSGV